MIADRFTVAICTRNRADFLVRCLDALFASLEGHDVPVIVVDNGSSDATAEVLRRYKTQIRCLYEPKAGLSQARNRALAECKTAYLVYLDDDAIPSLSWGTAAAEIAQAGVADIFGGPYTPFYTTEKPNWFQDEFGSAHLDLLDGLQPAGVCLSGGNMGWKVGLLRDAGGFDIDLGMVGDALGLGEETKLQLSLRRRHPNLKVIFYSKMTMRHHVPAAKMRLTYIAKRNFTFGWQLRDIDVGNPINNINFLECAKRTKLGAPLLLRLFHRNRKADPSWKTYAAKYLTLNSILLGAQLRRILG